MGVCASLEDDGVDVAAEDKIYGLAIGVCHVEG
jgi:hypothetical protein